MPFDLPPLPYAKEALEPHISARTIEYHYGKHHQAYVTNLNALVKDTPLNALSLEEVIRQTAKDESKAAVFNNAAQAWNHAFFWKSMTPDGPVAPPQKLIDAIASAFGDFATMKDQFKQAAIGQFGSGWAWLVQNENGALQIVKTPNAMTPFVLGLRPLLTCDVWEHAYYLDYQNRRPDFVQTFLDKLADWDFAAKNMA